MVVIEFGVAIGISDGSFKDQRGAVACNLEANKDASSRIYVLHEAPSDSSDQPPYRSELGEISMMLAVIQCIIKCHGI